MSRTRVYKSHPNVTGTDNCSTTKVWFTEICPKVTVANDVPNGVKDLPSALISWMHCSGEILSMLTCFLQTTEQEAPESYCNCV